MEKPQLMTHILLPVNFTCFDAKWIPSSARFVVLGAHPRNTGAINVYELDGTNARLTKEVEKPKPFKCGTFGASSIQQRNLATGNFDGVLDVWDLENLSSPIYSAKGHKNVINAIDGVGGLKSGCGPPEIATGSRDGVVKIWDTRQKDEPVATMVPSETSQSRDCWAVAFGNSFSNEDRCLCAGYDNGDVKLFDLRAMNVLWETNVKSGVCSIEFGRKDVEMDELVVTTLDSKFHLFNMKVQHPEKGFSSMQQAAHKGTIWSVRHSPHNRFLFMTAGGGGTVCLWKHTSSNKLSTKDSMGFEVGCTGTVEKLQESILSTQPISTLDWNADKNGLALCTSFDQAVRVLICTRLQLY